MLIMAQKNSQNRNSSRQVNPELYARLKAESKAPYRGFRKFIYLGFGASGFIGMFIFLTQILAGRDIDTALPNFALQVGVIVLMVLLWRWEDSREKSDQ